MLGHGRLLLSCRRPTCGKSAVARGRWPATQPRTQLSGRRPAVGRGSHPAPFRSIRPCAHLGVHPLRGSRFAGPRRLLPAAIEALAECRAMALRSRKQVPSVKPRPDHAPPAWRTEKVAPAVGDRSDGPSPRCGRTDSEIFEAYATASPEIAAHDARMSAEKPAPRRRAPRDVSVVEGRTVEDGSLPQQIAIRRT